MTKKIKSIGTFALSIVVFFMLFQMLFPKAKPLLSEETKTELTNKKQKEVIRFVAVGDSLTEGVGDSTNSGGYVPVLAKSITDEYKLNAFQTKKFGIAGERSDQILKRIKNDEELKEALKKADVIAITVGGNDLMKVARENILKNISESTFEKPMVTYKKRVTSMYEEIRKINPTAPIYQFGIYNPYYYDFSYITELQDIVDNWNNASQEVVNEEENAYFISINELLYKGTNGEGGIQKTDHSSSSDTTSSTSSLKDELQNDLIFEGDRFHPNNLGYRLMADALKNEMVDTKEKWLIK